MTNESLPPLPPLPADAAAPADELRGDPPAPRTPVTASGGGTPPTPEASPVSVEPSAAVGQAVPTGAEPPLAADEADGVLRPEDGAGAAGPEDASASTMRVDVNRPAAQTEELARVLLGAELTIATAESLTGGALAAELVRVPGISASFLGGVVAYSTDVKRTVLDVDRDLLVARGAVDPEVAVQMARGVRSVIAADGRHADIGLSTTGVAGPEPSDGADAGVVFVGVSTLWGDKSVELDFRSLVVADDPVGSRQRIRQATVEAAVFNLLETLAAEAQD